MTRWPATGGRLTPAQIGSVLDLAAAAAAADSVAPLSEHVLLHLRYDAAGPGPGPAPGRDLVLTVNEEIAGYAYLDPPGHPGPEVSGELVIHPLHRRHGLGLALVRAVIAQAGFPAELTRQRSNFVAFGYFTGTRAGFGRGQAPDTPTIAVDQLVAEPTAVTIGGTDIVLYPSASGETADALMAYLPASGVLFTGDAMMPYVGAPFSAEGSPDGLIETLKFITGLQPRQLVHGHTPLTELFTMDAAAGLLPALSDLHQHALAAISAGTTLTGLLEENLLPGALRGHPAAVVPYLVIRDHYLQRLHHQHTGYWHSDGQGLEPVSPAQRAAALDLLADGEAERFGRAARALLAQRDHALALEIATAGLARHPGAAELTRLRQQALYRLMERHQLQDPFRFLIYAEMAGAQLGPAA